MERRWVLLAFLFLSALLACGCTKPVGTSATDERATDTNRSITYSDASADSLNPDTGRAVDVGELLRVPSESDNQPSRGRSRPNILLILTDDQSHRTVGCYGDCDWVKTPNIDQLATEGLRFTHAYGAPTCTVSRALLLTGLQPHAIQTLKLGVDNESYDPKVCRFWPSVLRQYGYTTSIIGKWHLGPDAGHGRDWDHSVVWRQMPGALGRGNKKRWYFDPPLAIDGADAQSVKGYATDLYTEAAERFIRREHERPWFLWLAYNAPHGPLLPHSRHKQRYADVDVLRRSSAGVASAPGAVADISGKVKDYHRLVCAVDEGVGAIRVALEETGQLDNTLIVFTSDQGYSFGEHGVIGKLAPFDANMRIPLIVRYPREIVAKTVCCHPVALLDLPPTFLSFAGVPVPWPMHGHNLRPILRDSTSPWKHPVLLENFYLHYGSESDVGRTTGATLNGIPWWISLAQGKYKYVRRLLDDTEEELYDLEVDSHELQNLAGHPEHAALLADHRRRAVDELRRTGAGLVDNMPEPRVIE